MDKRKNRSVHFCELIEHQSFRLVYSLLLVTLILNIPLSVMASVDIYTPLDTLPNLSDGYNSILFLSKIRSNFFCTLNTFWKMHSPRANFPK